MRRFVPLLLLACASAPVVPQQQPCPEPEPVIILVEPDLPDAKKPPDIVKVPEKAKAKPPKVKPKKVIDSGTTVITPEPPLDFKGPFTINTAPATAPKPPRAERWPVPVYLVLGALAFVLAALAWGAWSLVKYYEPPPDMTVPARSLDMVTVPPGAVPTAIRGYSLNTLCHATRSGLGQGGSDFGGLRGQIPSGESWFIVDMAVRPDGRWTKVSLEDLGQVRLVVNGRITLEAPVLALMDAWHETMLDEKERPVTLGEKVPGFFGKVGLKPPGVGISDSDTMWLEVTDKQPDVTVYLFGYRKKEIK